MKLTSICILAVIDFGRCRSIMSQYDSDAIAEEADHQVVPAPVAPKGPRASRARSSGNASDAAEVCFLCGEVLDPVNGTVVVWREQKYDGPCSAALEAAEK